MNKAAILGFVRHILTFGGGAGVTSGYLSESDLTAGVSAMLTLIGIVWSWWDKQGAK